jgi:predicted dehydrogenase
MQDASTVTLGAIALQGVRRAEPTLGETVGVLGLGILGQLTAQLLAAAGCRVIGADVDASRVATAVRNGMAHGVELAGSDFVERATALTDGFGADAVVITAATSSSDVLRSAFQACRKKGRVVIVGDVGLDVCRSDMYEKELDLRMSTSYGPGRYDATYEEHGRDYPIGYVRWTENRNMDEYLRRIAGGSVRLDTLSTETHPVEIADEAYGALKREGERPLLVVLEYSDEPDSAARTTRLRSVEARPGTIGVALVGAGAFAQSVHVPNLSRLRKSFELRAVVSRTGAAAKAVADQAEAAYATTDIDEVLSDDAVDLVVITTRHDLHAPLTLRALEAGKHVLVEKPLALIEGELEAIEAFYRDRPDGPLLVTGFNRRFSPPIGRVVQLLEQRATPIVVDYRMNAGFIPRDNWVHGPQGGGRNIGEACHIYDLFVHLTGTSEYERVDAQGVRAAGERIGANDNFAATIGFADGSICTLTYTALGHRDHPKERMEVFADTRVISLDDYRSVSVSGRGDGGWRSGTIQKGHVQELEAVAMSLREGGPWPISLDEQLAATRISFAVEERLRGAGASLVSGDPDR